MEFIGKKQDTYLAYLNSRKIPTYHANSLTLAHASLCLYFTARMTKADAYPQSRPTAVTSCFLICNPIQSNPIPTKLLLILFHRPSSLRSIHPFPLPTQPPDHPASISSNFVARRKSTPKNKSPTKYQSTVSFQRHCCCYCNLPSFVRLDGWAGGSFSRILSLSRRL